MENKYTQISTLRITEMKTYTKRFKQQNSQFKNYESHPKPPLPWRSMADEGSFYAYTTHCNYFWKISLDFTMVFLKVPWLSRNIPWCILYIKVLYLHSTFCKCMHIDNFKMASTMFCVHKRSL